MCRVRSASCAVETGPAASSMRGACDTTPSVTSNVPARVWNVSPTDVSNERLTPMIIEDCSRKDTKIAKAVAELMAYGPFLFTGVCAWDTDMLRERISLDISTIKNANGADLVGRVMRWVRTVQFRAFQDLAADPPQHFDDGWTTLHHLGWGMHWKHYTRIITERENRDIGWV